MIEANGTGMIIIQRKGHNWRYTDHHFLFAHFPGLVQNFERAKQQSRIFPLEDEVFVFICLVLLQSHFVEDSLPS